MALLTITLFDVHLQNGSHPCICIGRAPGDENEIHYWDPKVSRRHCKICEREDGSVGIFDEGSTNGTYLNGRRISSSIHGFRIAPGDLITLRDPRKPHHDIRINSIQISQPNEPERVIQQIIHMSY